MDTKEQQSRAILELGQIIERVAQNEQELGMATHTASYAIDVAVNFIMANLDQRDPKVSEAIKSLLKTQARIEEALNE